MFVLNRTITRCSVNLLQIAKYSVNITDNALIFKSNFTSEEQQKVLSILNGPNLKQLASFNVSQSRIKNLEVWKTKKGPFRSLNDVLEVDGLGEKVLEKICENIITENVNEKVGVKKNNYTNKRLKQVVTPPLSTNVINKIQSVVGIHLGPMGISWARLSRLHNELNNWNSEGFGSLPKKMLLTDTFELALRIIRKLPPGDIYVFEANHSMSPQSSTQVSTVSSYTQQLELTSMLVALLNTSPYHNASIKTDFKNSCVDNVVYHVRSKLPARLFRTLVGTERVSAVTTVMELVQNDGKSNPFSLPCTPIVLKDELKSAFLTQPSAEKELLGQALILVVSFMDLCVYKNPVSLVAIAPNRNNK